MIEPINLVAKNIPQRVITLMEDAVVLRASHHERHCRHLEGSGDRREWSEQSGQTEQNNPLIWQNN